VLVLSVRQRFVKGTIPVLTWEASAGESPWALALSIPAVTERPLLLTATYAVVLFTIIVQGLSLPAVVKQLS
jgi:CPA1 family monovalent cation:H+ antiporter